MTPSLVEIVSGAIVMRAERDAALRGPNEIHHLNHFGRKLAGLEQALDRKLQVLTRVEQRAECVPQRMDRFVGDASALQSDHIDAAQRMGAIHDAEWRHVAAGAR